MSRNRRETFSLLAGAAPVALGALSIAGMTGPGHAEEVKPTAGTPQMIDTRIGTLEFTHDFANGYPTDATCDPAWKSDPLRRGIGVQY